jgi:hypothetical protein
MTIINELNRSASDSAFEELSKKLKLEGVINKDILDIERPDVTNKILVEMMETPSKLLFTDSGELYFINSEGENTFIEANDDAFDEHAVQVCKVLPDCPFDVECGGIKSAQVEAVAMYKVLVVNNVVQNLYKDDILDIVKTYDFQRKRSINGDLSFTILLKEITESATPVIRVVLTCLNVKLINFKAKNETSYTGIISREDAQNLDGLIKQVSLINYNRNEKAKSSKDKLERLLNEKERMLEIEKLLDSCGDRIQLLYRVYNLTTDVVPTIKDIKIRQSARQIVNELRIQGKILSDEFQKEFQKTLVRRARRQVLREIKEVKYEKFALGEFNDLIPKL